LLFLTSCDHEYDYTYEVRNESDSAIKVELITDWVDSTYLIGATQSKILFIIGHGFEGPNGPYFADVTEDLDSIVVVKDDTLISNKNYLENSAWEYKNGLYQAIVSNDEFE
jgi:hypothetical protein